MERSIRAARIEDAEAMAALHVRAWQAAYRGILTDEFLDGLSVEEWAKKRREALGKPASPDTRWWVLERGAILEGFCVTGPSRDPDAAAGEAEVYAIYVEPVAVGRGLGRLLMEHALADLGRRGIARASLWVFEENARARAFYEKAGFRRDEGAPPKVKEFGGTRAPEVRYRVGPGEGPAG